MRFCAPPKRVGRQFERTYKTGNADFRTQADVAAEKILIHALEAGAKITDFVGNQNVEDANETFLLSNGTSIHEFLVENVTRFRAAGKGNEYVI